MDKEKEMEESGDRDEDTQGGRSQNSDLSGSDKDNSSRERPGHRDRGRQGRSSRSSNQRGQRNDRSRRDMGSPEEHRERRSSDRGTRGRRDFSSFLDGIGVPKPAPFKPDEFQLRAIESVSNGEDTLVVAPTGTGKTYIAVQSIASIVSKGRRAVYTAPLKALSNTKYVELKKKFEPDFTVGLLTGDRKIDGDADIVVATTEIYRNELYNYGENYSLVVLDEFHYLADSQRGPVWEESIILSPKNSTLLMLSASVSNAEEIAEWIEEVRGRKVKIIVERHRPVELRLGFMHPGLGVMPLENTEGELLSEVIDFYAPRRDADFRYNKSNRKGHSRGRGRRR